jgi:hypothetical protein
MRSQDTFCVLVPFAVIIAQPVSKSMAQLFSFWVGSMFQLNPKVMKTTYEKNYEVDNATGLNHEGPKANTPVRRLTATSIIGDKVQSPRGDDLMVNLLDGSVEYAIIEFGSFLGMGGKLFAIPFNELQVDPVKELFVLNRDKEYLKDIPGFDKGHWPDTNAHTYFNEVNMHWERQPVSPVDY